MVALWQSCAMGVSPTQCWRNRYEARDERRIARGETLRSILLFDMFDSAWNTNTER